MIKIKHGGGGRGSHFDMLGDGHVAPQKVGAKYGDI